MLLAIGVLCVIVGAEENSPDANGQTPGAGMLIVGGICIGLCMVICAITSLTVQIGINRWSLRSLIEAFKPVPIQTEPSCEAEAIAWGYRTPEQIEAFFERARASGDEFWARWEVHYYGWLRRKSWMFGNPPPIRPDQWGTGSQPPDHPLE